MPDLLDLADETPVTFRCLPEVAALLYEAARNPAGASSSFLSHLAEKIAIVANVTEEYPPGCPFMWQSISGAPEPDETSSVCPVCGIRGDASESEIDAACTGASYVTDPTGAFDDVESDDDNDGDDDRPHPVH